MTDGELVQLLEQKTPDELTLVEIDLLRQRLAESDELRELLLTQLQMETYLTTAFSRVNLSPQQIVARAQQHQQSSFGTTTLLVGLLCMPLIALVAALAVAMLRDDRQPVEVAAAQPEASPPEESEGTPAAVPAKGGEKSASEGGISGESPAQARPMNPPMPMPAAPMPVAPAPAPAAPKLPWQAAVDFAGQPPPFTEVAFQNFTPGKFLPQVNDLKPWLSAVPGHNHRLTMVDTQAGKCAALEGMARLNSPWPENSVLRLALEHYNRLQMHFFHENAGVTLIYYEDQAYRWAAYATTREPGKAVPKTWAITATDDDRSRRTELRFGGLLELRWQAGELILSRGDIVLVSAPLAGPPKEVYFEGRAAFQGIDLQRASGAPSLPPSNPVVLDNERPADLPWKALHAETAPPELLATGGVRFAANEAKQHAHYMAPLPPGLNEIVLELDEVSPGAGVFLTRAHGRVLELLRFFRNPKNDQLYLQLHYADDTADRDLPLPSEQPLPIAGPHCWVKLLYGCGHLHAWISADGTHWAYVVSRPTEGDISGIGIDLVAKRKDVRLTLRRIVLRELTGLTALASSEIQAQAIPLPQSPSIGHWLVEAASKQPAGIDSADWLRACAIRTLAAGCASDLSHPLLEALLDDATQRGLALDQQLAALNDAMLLVWDPRDNGAMRVGLPRRYVELGLRAADEVGLPAWSSVRYASSSAPIVMPYGNPLDLERSVRWQSIQASAAGEPGQTLAWTRELRFFQQHRHSPLIDWLETFARRDAQPANRITAPGPAGGDIARIKEGWREPLMEEISKDAYNAMTELQAVLESEAWEDAARVVTSLDPEAAPGVAPYVKDKSLLASLPVAVQLTLADFPQLRESLGGRFAALAKLRIGQAIAAGDAATVELATVQFANTEASAEAHRWLGDRALASGWFAQAIAAYQRALFIQPSLLIEIAPRIRLAAAMLGRDEPAAGGPVTRPVQFGEVNLTAAEFEALVAEMRTRGQATSLAVPPTIITRFAPPKPFGFEAQVRSRLDGPVGDRPQEEVGRRTNQFRVPWADRQIATAVEGDLLYVTNRFQVAAYNLTNGQRAWQSQPPPGPVQRSQDWAMIAMRPLITADRIFVRQLYSPNPQLVCLNKANGQLLWVADPIEREYVVSDPVIVQGRLVALSTAVQPDNQAVLRWCVYDPLTGELQQQRDLVRLRSTWGSRACCELAATDDGLIAVLGGITLATDTAGNLRWIRKHVTLPAEEEPRWVLQMYHPPLIDGGRMFVAQPGVRDIECLDVATGRRNWLAVLPEVVGLVGLAQGRLIARTETDIRALDLATGKTEWRYPATELHSFQLPDDTAILVASREQLPNQTWQTRLTWLDPATGQPTMTTPLPALVDADPRLGPLVSFKDRLFTFFGRGQHDPNRDFVELIPKGEAERAVPLAYLNDPWRQRLPPNLPPAAFHRLGSDWLLLSGQGGDRTGTVDDAHGVQRVLGVRSTAAWPVAVGREVTVPTQGKPRLRMRIANDAGQTWKLETRHGSEIIATEEITDAKYADRWKTIEIDLSAARGKTGWLTFRAQSTNGDHVLYIERVELVF
jgi:outer membrane protein assembly factor BamB